MATNKFKKLKTKDRIVIILSIAIIIILAAIIIQDKISQTKEEETLYELTTSTTSSSNITTDLDNIYINEVNESGWIELYNSDTEKEDISGLSIYLNGDKIYTFADNTTIDAKDYLVVETKTTLGTTTHDIIALGDDTMTSYLGTSGRYIVIPKLSSGQSYGYTDLTFTSTSIMSQTKNGNNSKATLVESDEDINFSVIGGYYDSEFSLELSANSNKTIYYTTDGSIPTTDSTIYTGEITIKDESGSDLPLTKEVADQNGDSYVTSSSSKGTVIRAIAVDENGNASSVYTQTYYIGQSSSTDVSNYATISITIDPDDFANYFTGIYVKGTTYESALARGLTTTNYANYLNGDSRNVTVEYFEKSKDKTYEGNLSLSVINDYTVSTSQKSLLLTSDSDVDWDGSTITNFFGGTSNTLTLTTNLTDNTYKIREYLASNLLEDTKVASYNLTPVAVFINGEYWGLYCLRATIDANYIASQYNLDSDNVVVSTTSGVVDDDEYAEYGSEYAYIVRFIKNNDMSDSDNYAKVTSAIDIDSYIQFMATNIYLSNPYLDSDTKYVWRTISTDDSSEYSDGKWRYIYTPLDGTMANSNANGYSSATINTYLFDSIANDTMFNSLLENDDFKAAFKATMEQYANEIFNEENVSTAIDTVSSVLEKGTENSYKRFLSSSSLTTLYNNELTNIEEFFKTRAEYILKYTNEL